MFMASHVTTMCEKIPVCLSLCDSRSFLPFVPSSCPLPLASLSSCVALLVWEHHVIELHYQCRKPVFVVCFALQRDIISTKFWQINVWAVLQFGVVEFTHCDTCFICRAYTRRPKGTLVRTPILRNRSKQTTNKETINSYGNSNSNICWSYWWINDFFSFHVLLQGLN